VGGKKKRKGKKRKKGGRKGRRRGGRGRKGRGKVASWLLGDGRPCTQVRGVWKSSDFRPLSRRISQTVHYRAITITITKKFLQRLLQYGTAALTNKKLSYRLETGRQLVKGKEVVGGRRWCR